MRLNWASVPLSKRGFPRTGKASLSPLSITTTTRPSENLADNALSIKVFIPLLKNQFLVVFRKLFRLGQLLHLQAGGLPQRNFIANPKDRFPTTMPNVNVDRRVFVAVKEKTVSILLKYLGHVSH